MSMVCMDCAWHNAAPLPVPMYDEYVCPHFTQEYWEKQGFQRTWGDAAVNNYPLLTILRRATDTGSEFVILAPKATRRPVLITTKDKDAWGSY
jgi:hypothetical protein